jgi:hypothetical protein
MKCKLWHESWIFLLFLKFQYIFLKFDFLEICSYIWRHAALNALIKIELIWDKHTKLAYMFSFSPFYVRRESREYLTCRFFLCVIFSKNMLIVISLRCSSAPSWSSQALYSKGLHLLNIFWLILTNVNILIHFPHLYPFPHEHIVKNGHFHWKASSYKFKLATPWCIFWMGCGA